jgi:hypothetical protein
MPTLQKVLKEADLAGSRAPAGMDLGPYLELIDSIRGDGGVGGEVALAADESQRTEKRRLSLAAKQRGYKLTWRKARSGGLKFLLSQPGQAAPGGRRRRKAS